MAPINPVAHWLPGSIGGPGRLCQLSSQEWGSEPRVGSADHKWPQLSDNVGAGRCKGGNTIPYI